MEIEQKWFLPEELLRNAFEHLSIDEELYSLFKARANRCVNELAKQFEPEPPDKEDYDYSIETATTYIQEFARQVHIGHSKLWSEKYSYYLEANGEVYSVQDAFNAVMIKHGKDKADQELTLYAKSLNDDPVFVESYIYFFHDGFEDPEKTAKEFVSQYNSLIKKGKSDIYAEQYALQILGNDPAYCELYASKFEESINKGRDKDKSRIIANAYKNLYYDYWPKDDNYLGIEAHKGYMKGFEYAIDNGIGSPGTFAEDYMKAYLHSLFPDEEEPPCKSKGKYDDIISKLLLNTD
jgi:hypothetical protein